MTNASMSESKVFRPEWPWHSTHVLRGTVNFHRLGPSGREVCKQCGAERWANTAEFDPSCGGSVDYDTRAERPCATPFRLEIA